MSGVVSVCRFVRVCHARARLSSYTTKPCRTTVSRVGGRVYVSLVRACMYALCLLVWCSVVVVGERLVCVCGGRLTDPRVHVVCVCLKAVRKCMHEQPT